MTQIIPFKDHFQTCNTVEVIIGTVMATIGFLTDYDVTNHAR